MRANFDNKLSELNKKLLSMAAMTEQIIAMSIKSLEEQDTKLARETVEFDARINEAEREVERIDLFSFLFFVCICIIAPGMFKNVDIAEVFNIRNFTHGGWYDKSNTK